MEEGDFRRKIGWFQFCCCVMVIWNHSGNAELFLGRLEQSHPLMHLQYGIFPAIIRVSIPCFFMVSGYQFFRGFTMKKLGGKWKRRVKTLLIPYLTWNFLYYIGYQAANQIFFLKEIVNKPHIGFSLTEIIQSVVFYRYHPLFWFMYQLILLVILAPVFYLVLRQIWSGLLLLMCLLAGVFYIPFSQPLNLDAAFYYLFAGFCALHGQKAVEATWTFQRGALGIVFLVFGIQISRLYYKMAFIPAIVLYHVLAVMGLWLLINADWLKIWKPWMGYTFFIYAFHFIPVRFLNKTMALWFEGSQAMALFLYLIMPVFAIAVCCLTAKLLWPFPKVWSVLSGGKKAYLEEKP